MTVAEKAVDILIENGVSDTFGIPGGVILPFLYAMEKREPEISPHLNYHEQMAGFAACGYAQAKGGLGVAYATRGPGITNMLTCIAEAYKESLPVLFVTAHGNRKQAGEKLKASQELDLVSSVSDFTKFAANIEVLHDFEKCFRKACKIAMEEQRGPVFLDFYAPLFDEEVCAGSKDHYIKEEASCFDQSELALYEIADAFKKASRPVLLIGEGLRRASDMNNVTKQIEALGIPVLSSRCAQDIVCRSEQYFGYIGSHGTRYSNFILSKADLLIVLGNRMAFPIGSKSFSPIINHAKIIRLDIDEDVFEQEIPNAKNFKVDVRLFFKLMQKTKFQVNKHTKWLSICKKIKATLNEYDISVPVEEIIQFLEKQSLNCIYVCDVGNNEFWFARAYEKVRPGGEILCSKYFGTLGSALGRAIGAYYATKKKIICILGDQGFQYNLQELQFISHWKLPVQIVLLNNASSGMIVEHEKKIFGEKLVHCTLHSGYSIPNFRKIVEAFGIPYIAEANCCDQFDMVVLEIIFDEKTELSPNLPVGNACEDMYPPMETELFAYISSL